MNNIQTIGIAMAADVLRKVRYDLPYKESEFCFLIQTQKEIYEYKKYFYTFTRSYYADKCYKGVGSQLLPHLASEGFDKVVLLTDPCTLHDIIVWLMMLVKQDPIQPSALFIKPYFKGCSNHENLRKKITEVFPAKIRLMKTESHNIYFEEIHECGNELHEEHQACKLPFSYIFIEEYNPTVPLPSTRARINQNVPAPADLNIIGQGRALSW